MKKTIVHGGAAQNGRAGASAGASGGGGGGNISGTLTAGKIPIATGANTIADSQYTSEILGATQIQVPGNGGTFLNVKSAGVGVQSEAELQLIGGTNNGTISQKNPSYLGAGRTARTPLLIEANKTPVVISASDATNGDVEIYTNGDNLRFQAKANGDVLFPTKIGVGDVTSPVTQFDIKKTAGTAQARIQGDFGSTLQMVGKDSSSVNHQWDVGVGIPIGYDEFAVFDRTVGASRLTIKSNGDVLLPSLPSLSTLGTDATGKIIAGSGGGGGFGAFTTYSPNLFGGVDLGVSCAYVLNGKYMTIFFNIDELTPGTTIPIGIPAGYTIQAWNRNFASSSVHCTVNTGSGDTAQWVWIEAVQNDVYFLVWRQDGVAWTAGAPRLKMYGQLTVMVQ